MLQQEWNMKMTLGDFCIPPSVLSSSLSDFQKILYGDVHRILTLNGPVPIEVSYFADRLNKSEDIINKTIRVLIKKKKLVVVKKESAANKRILGPDPEFVEELRQQGISFYINTTN